jgi:hypothetical protein
MYCYYYYYYYSRCPHLMYLSNMLYVWKSIFSKNILKYTFFQLYRVCLLFKTNEEAFY